MPKTKPKDLISTLQSQIHAYEQEEAGEIAFLLLEKYLKLSKTDLVINNEFELRDEQIPFFDKLINRINQFEPVQYILGEQWFRNFRFEVGPGVLIPRPETEEMISIVLKESHKIKGTKKVIDIGTGSGCIAVSLALELPNASVSAIDISEQALAIASRNAINNKAAVQFFRANILDPDLFHDEKYDIIVSNPPYVKENEKQEMRKNVLDHEPELALFVPNDDPLLFYRKIADFGLLRLNSQGFIVVEINSYLGTETKGLFEEKGYTHVSLIKDFYEKDRFILARH